MYEGVRDVLQKYRSGKLPKAFKMVPHLQNWEQILYITEPTTWSAAAMYQVSLENLFKIFHTEYTIYIEYTESVAVATLRPAYV